MTTTITSKVLKDVVAYVDVWSASKTENYSDPFIQQLRDMGAQVNKTFNKQVTHVVFKHGHQATWNKAKKLGLKIVSVHWVARCKENTEHADEDLYPAQNEESKLSHFKKRTHRCMQPRDVPVSTPKRLKRKLDKMMEDLVRSSPVVAVTDSDTSPFIIDEEHGIVYSPSSKRADTMAQRLREMRAQRENLSPTASQIQDSQVDNSRPSLGETPTDFSMPPLDDEEEATDSLSQTDGRVEKPPHDLVNPSGIDKPVNVRRSPQNKSQRRSNPGITKQSSVDSYVSKKSTRKSVPHPLPTREGGTAEKSRKSSGSIKISNISSPLGNTETEVSQTPLNTKTKAKPAESGTFSSRVKEVAKYDFSAKSNNFILKFAQKAPHKAKQADVPGSDNHFDMQSDGDDSVFEDYFTSTKSAPRRKVVLAHSSSGAMPLPSFDLEPMNRNRRKSHSQINNSTNRRRSVLIDKDLMEASELARTSDKALQAPNVAASGPQCEPTVTKVSKFEDRAQEPATKKQRRRTEQVAVSFSESKDDKLQSSLVVVQMV